MFPVCVLLTFAAAASAAVHDSVNGIPHGWQPSPHSVPDSAAMKLFVSLQYQNIDQLQSQLEAVSTPNSPLYGQYQDVNEQNAMFAPAPDAASKVIAWLKQHNAGNVQQTGNIVSFTSSVGQVNKMLNTTFQMYSDGSSSRLRTTEYSVPGELASYVDTISPTTYFGDMKPQSPVSVPFEQDDLILDKRAADPSCQVPYTSPRTGTKYLFFTPECAKQAYNTVGYDADPKSGSNIAFANFLGQSPSYADLAQFEDYFKIPPQNFTVLALINGGVNDQSPTASNGEADLDVEYIVGVSDGLPVYTYITGGTAPFVPDLEQQNASQASNEPYLQYYDYLLRQPNSKLPYVISQSYGDHENTVPNRYAARVCNQIGLLGLRGRSVLVSSGDGGVGSVCRDNRPSGNLYGKPQFEPTFPCSCPYVTCVGGTQSLQPVEAWNASQGGFSNYYSTAWYQKGAVSTYLSQHISPATKQYYSSNGYVDFGGRGIPDVSAHSLYPYYFIINNGAITGSGGTSAACPVVASIVALLNDARFRAGKPSMGFLNPFLYGLAAGDLNDVTKGGAVGCLGTDLQNGNTDYGGAVIPYASWNATPGWDPATGLGTPDFQKLKAKALSVGKGKGGPGGPWGWKGYGW